MRGLRITLEPGEKKTEFHTYFGGTLSHPDRDLKSVVEPGIFKVMVGKSSEDIQLTGSFEVKKRVEVSGGKRRGLTKKI